MSALSWQCEAGRHGQVGFGDEGLEDCSNYVSIFHKR